VYCAEEAHKMPDLFPTFEFPADEAAPLSSAPQYPSGPLFDFAAGDFARDGAGRIVQGDGRQMWVQWCLKTMRTQRFAYLAYSGQVGIEAAEALAEPDRVSQEDAFVETITEALCADPLRRTREVRDFEFSWEADALRITCVVEGAGGEQTALDASYPL
jgi:hypothetical protein